ncbi:MAG: hypothetical protein KDA61_18470 [Planctomycetales bacterium]|nr:hypothetical protein [Planctomycetales bacterium]
MRAFLIGLAGVAAALVAGVLWRHWRRMQADARRRLAICDFLEGREASLEPFLETASSLGEPRGLRWEECRFHDGQRFAVDCATNELYALVGTTIRFSAIEGGGMEDVEAVSNLRCATAVFVHRNGQWTTDGRTVFNLEPDEAIVHFAGALEPLSADAS